MNPAFRVVPWAFSMVAVPVVMLAACNIMVALSLNVITGMAGIILKKGGSE